MLWVSQDTVGVPAHSLAPGGSCQQLHGKMPVSLLLSPSNIPQISSLLGSPARSGRGAGPRGHGVGGWESSRSQKVESGAASPLGLFPNANAITLVSTSGRKGKSSAPVCSWVNRCLESWRVYSQAGR